MIMVMLAVSKESGALTEVLKRVLLVWDVS